MRLRIKYRVDDRIIVEIQGLYVKSGIAFPKTMCSNRPVAIGRDYVALLG